ncbi:MAG: molybdenum cofactor guanylyltransferase [Rubellimicrobium sp.]|nr:molybdenum cofactor guanylyltransferase [Rubellimicrobium sp.]
MGGGDKGLVPFRGATLLDAVIARIAPQVRALALNANGDPARFVRFGLPVLPDPVPGHPGPLAGVLAAMGWAADQGAARVLTVPTDTPDLPADLLARLDAADPALVAMALDAAGNLHPTVALWPVAGRAALAAFLAGGGRRVRAYAASAGMTAIPFAAATPDPFANLNRPGDLA